MASSSECWYVSPFATSLEREHGRYIARTPPPPTPPHPTPARAPSPPETRAAGEGAVVGAGAGAGGHAARDAQYLHHASASALSLKPAAPRRHTRSTRTRSRWSSGRSRRREEITPRGQVADAAGLATAASRTATASLGRAKAQPTYAPPHPAPRLPPASPPPLATLPPPPAPRLAPSPLAPRPPNHPPITLPKFQAPAVFPG